MRLTCSNIPGMLELEFQGMIENVDVENLEFQIMLTNNYYTNPDSMHTCFPMKHAKIFGLGSLPVF